MQFSGLADQRKKPYNKKAEREYLRKEAFEEGMEKGKRQYITLIENALDSTHSIKQTALLLKLQKDEVRKIAKDAGIPVKDI